MMPNGPGGPVITGPAGLGSRLAAHPVSDGARPHALRRRTLRRGPHPPSGGLSTRRSQRAAAIPPGETAWLGLCPRRGSSDRRHHRGTFSRPRVIHILDIDGLSGRRSRQRGAGTGKSAELRNTRTSHHVGTPQQPGAPRGEAARARSVWAQCSSRSVPAKRWVRCDRALPFDGERYR
jgi:hypothetical protein